MEVFRPPCLHCRFYSSFPPLPILSPPLSIKHLLAFLPARGGKASLIGQLDRRSSKPRGLSSTLTKWTLYDGAGLSHLGDNRDCWQHFGMPLPSPPFPLPLAFRSYGCVYRWSTK
ncbi:hypothetical protein CDAR_168731 [Caerostris darwini]|uniref:Uncharacterized protein n=1 Tax=Caerostris darwini TaxID=1538125 RepID=A0AAV4WS84_9ARAC|nr:hypothetical protein CDAR_168731 [Caerostris darwini]